MTHLPTTREEVESRMGVAHIAVLTAQRHALVVENARRHALYGPAALWKDTRDRLQALVAVGIRRELADAERKITDRQVQEYVMIDPRVIAFSESVHEGIVQYIVAEDAIRQVNDLIQRDAAISRHTAAEMRL